MSEYNANDKQSLEIVQAMIDAINTQSTEIKGGLTPLDVRRALITATSSIFNHFYPKEHYHDEISEHLYETWATAQGDEIVKLHPINRIGRFCMSMFETAAGYEDLDPPMVPYAATRLFTSLLMELAPIGRREAMADLMMKQIKEMVAMAEVQERAMGSVMPEGAVN